MGRMIAGDLKTALRAKRFWIAVAVFIFSAAINVIEQHTMYRASLTGGLDLFTFGNVYCITLIGNLAPFIPAFILGPIVTDGIRSKDYLAQTTGLKRYVSARSLSGVVIGGGIFVVSYLIILLICFIIDPSLKAALFVPRGTFKDLYTANPTLFILAFFAHTTLFGALYGLFSAAVGLLTKKSWIAMTLPGIVYFAARYLWPYCDNSLLSWVPLPGYEFDIESGFTVSMLAERFGAVLAVSVILVILSYFRLKKEARKPDTDNHTRQEV